MSHFTTIKTVISDLECLRKALKDLNYQFQEGIYEIKDYEGRKTKVEIKFFIENKEFGFCFSDDKNTYELIGDWYEIKGNHKKYTDQILQRYAYHKVIKELHQKGLVISEEQKLNDGAIKVVVKQW